jgi:hypothetical protein
VAARRIVVLPLRRLGALVVVTGVAHELKAQIFDRGEDAAADHVARDAAGPVLDSVPLGRMSWRVVDRHPLALRRERGDKVGLVAAGVVADDLDLAAFGLAGHDIGQEPTNCSLVWRGAVIPRTSPGGIQRGEQAQGAIALVFEAVALGTPSRQRQHAVLAVQHLDRGRLIDAGRGRVRSPGASEGSVGKAWRAR